MLMAHYINTQYRHVQIMKYFDFVVVVSCSSSTYWIDICPLFWRHCASSFWGQGKRTRRILQLLKVKITVGGGREEEEERFSKPVLLVTEVNMSVYRNEYIRPSIHCGITHLKTYTLYFKQQRFNGWRCSDSMYH